MPKESLAPSPPDHDPGPEPAPLHDGFLRSARDFPERPSLQADGVTLSYRELSHRARQIAATLERHTPPGGAPITAVFAYRTPTAYAGILGVLLRGHGYVALNRTFPPGRSRGMMEKADVRALVVDQGSSEQLDELLSGLDHPVLLLLPDHDDVSELRLKWPQHRVLGSPDLIDASQWTPPSVDPDSIAYLIFTSGSTGTPKAVQVPHRHVRRYVDLMAEHWNISELDRLSQTFDMTFDLSVSDMFLAWERGACLCCLPRNALMKPGKFIRDSELTVWYAVPSVGLLMRRLGMLKPDSYPTLRLVLFCGEPLPKEIAAAWAEAAPNAVVENVYGPTEVTISCAHYRWDSAKSPAECEFGVVPIGSMYAGMEALVVDEALREVPPGEVGELLVCGPQVTPGYWRDQARSEAVFVSLPGGDTTYYRTGDRVRRSVEPGPMTYLGRLDFQVKISGHRVELGEIEAVLRELTGSSEVVALGWPKTETGYSGVAAFVGAEGIDPSRIREAMLARLPDYMVPREIRAIQEFPLNVNGKFDRNALLEMLEGTS
jgi:amino acid adenylation domain-containing protein